MKENSVDSVIFNGILSRLNSLYGDGGGMLHDGGGDSFSLAYQARPDNAFQHNYQRDKFLHTRDKYSIVEISNKFHVIVKLTFEDEVTIYKAPVELYFKAESEKALQRIEKIMKKLYSKVSIENISGITVADYSTGRSANHVGVI